MPVLSIVFIPFANLFDHAMHGLEYQVRWQRFSGQEMNAKIAKNAPPQVLRLW
jgi:predicted deacylase